MIKIDKDSIKKSVSHFGKTEQLFVACEEMAELIQQISKIKRAEFHKETHSNEHLIEEIADTYIMLENLKQIFGISDNEINEIIFQKQVRLTHRIDFQENYEDG